MIGMDMKNMELTVTKIFDFACAHNLTYHEGKCKFIHGHNYKICITVKPSTSFEEKNHYNHDHNVTEFGMVVDFSKLKKIVNEKIIDVYDHSFMVWDNPEDSTAFTQKLKSLINTVTKKEVEEANIQIVNFRPTAENMCIHFYELLEDPLLKECNLKIARIRIFETDTSYAEIVNKDA